MTQGTDSRDDIAQQIAARVTRAVHPWRIVLFGSRARGRATKDSDYDVYVEVDVDRAALKEIHGQIWDLFNGTGWTLDLKIARRGDLERRRDDPGTLEWDVAREGTVLYADPSAAPNIAPPDRVREPPPAPPESMYEWLEAAERDIRHSSLLRDASDDYSQEICWLSHQTVEKHMKALLVGRHVRPERTHKLVALLAALRGAGCALEGLDADCELLTKHAVSPRYPGDLDLGPDDARAAFEAAERVIAAVRLNLPPRIH
ncbi:MAG: HEPN domain-containing protein [Gemmatimonadaceae bacterium]